MKLDDLVEKQFRLTERQKKGLKKLGLITIKDVLRHFPSRYESFTERKNIIDLTAGDKTTVYGKILSLKLEKSWKKRMPLAQVTLADNTGALEAVWFHQPYIANILREGDKVAFTGKIALGKSGLYIANPSYEKINSYEGLGEGSTLLAVYPETIGISSRWLRAAVAKIFNNLEKFPEETIPEEILKKYHLPRLKSSFIFIHSPQKLSDAEAARKRFSFEEIFFIQTARLKQRLNLDKKHAFKIEITDKQIKDFLSVFPFTLTKSQNEVLKHILQDLKKDKPMCRLLEGDVGSGKTAVAVASAYAVVNNGFQVAYMAPTEILARQHFDSFIKYFSQSNKPVRVGLITSSECKKYPSKVEPDKATHISKAQLLKWVMNGEIPILVGTHSLIQQSVKFKNLGFVIIDEQHRFGARQRSILAAQKSEKIPHLLSMTATPIPRTLALTIYSDLDLSLLDEMPAGRQKIYTQIIDSENRSIAYEQIRAEIQSGRQMYIICPRIDEADPDKFNALNMKAVKTESARLKKEIFPEFEVGILHGKILPKEKEEILNNFRQNKIQILVATSVVEVGIDIPNATIIIIEGAERFGLAQLHQLRGRVIRGNYQPYCYIFTESNTQKTKQRLNALIKAKNGFELAEYDLKFRGSGELGGGKQWGVSDIGMEALKNLKMVEAARLESQNLLQKDPDLNNHPLILERINSQTSQIHFE